MGLWTTQLSKDYEGIGGSDEIVIMSHEYLLIAIRSILGYAAQHCDNFHLYCAHVLMITFVHQYCEANHFVSRPFDYDRRHVIGLRSGELSCVRIVLFVCK